MSYFINETPLFRMSKLHISGLKIEQMFDIFSLEQVTGDRWLDTGEGKQVRQIWTKMKDLFCPSIFI